MQPPHQLQQLATKNVLGIICFIPLLAMQISTARAQDADELAKQLSNPIANLISEPFQNNVDFGGAPD